MKIIKEDIENLERYIGNAKVGVHTDLPIVMADAYEDSKKRQEEIDKEIEEKNKDNVKLNKVIGAEKQPVPKLPEEAKVNLEESLFEDYDSDVRHYSDMLFYMIEEEVVDAKQIAQSLIYWCSEDDIERFMRVNELIWEEDEDESLEESYIKADIPSRDKVAKFIEDSKEELLASENEGGCYRLVLDDDLCLYVGWESGFNKDNGHDGWEVCAKIAERNDYDWADFEFLNMPWYSNDGEVWDTSISDPDASDADWFIKSYEGIRDALDNNEIVLESLKKSRNKKLVELKEARGRKASPFVDSQGNSFGDEDRSEGQDELGDDIYNDILDELTAADGNLYRRTKIPEIPQWRRYSHLDIGMDDDLNILIYRKTEDDFELAKKVAEVYGLETRGPIKSGNNYKFTLVMPKEE